MKNNNNTDTSTNLYWTNYFNKELSKIEINVDEEEEKSLIAQLAPRCITKSKLIDKILVLVTEYNLLNSKLTKIVDTSITLLTTYSTKEDEYLHKLHKVNKLSKLNKLFIFIIIALVILIIFILTMSII